MRSLVYKQYNGRQRVTGSILYQEGLLEGIVMNLLTADWQEH